MKLLTNKLTTAVQAALAVGAFALAGSAFAQDAPASADQAAPEQAKTLQAVTVTGTRIRSVDFETAQPIIVLDRAAIQRQGFNSVADILQNLPEAGSPPISRASVLASGENVGGYYVDLRNLGANRTLVLLNGKRLGTTTDGLQDLSQVPISAIDRVEVLKDGASAIYGSDAIAGVVNLITRRDFDGAEASAYVGQYDQGDGDKQTYSMTMGAHSDRGSVQFTAEYSKEDPVWARNRPYSAFPSTSRHPTAGWSIVSKEGNFFMPPPYCPLDVDPDDGSTSNGLCALNPGGSAANPADWHSTGAGGGTNDRTNTNLAMMLNTGIERHSLFVSGDYSITDNIKFSSDFLYNKRSTTQQVAGYPFQPAFYLPFTLPDDVTAIGLSPDSYFNPTGEKIDFYRRGWEVPRVTRNDLQTYRFSGTLEGSFDIGERTYNWDVGGFVNNNDLLKIQHGDFSLIGLTGALGPSFLDPTSGLVTCGAPDNALPYGSAPGSCVPWNPFIPASQSGPNSLSDPTLQAYLFPFYHDTGNTRTVDYTANLTGPIFALPAGDLSFAAGFEYRRESGEFVPDAFSQAGISTNLSSGPTGGSYNVKEYYAEVEAPLLKDVPFARQLTVNVASRYSDYSSFGTTTNNKYSFTWKPIDDLLVRGTYAEGFRAPTIGDLFGGISGTFDFYTDPCDVSNGSASINPAVAARCSSGFGGQPGTPAGFVQLGQGGAPCTNFPCQTGTQFFAGANPNLEPETSIGRTLGLVYSPSWVEGLDLSLDWYRVRINNAITPDSTTDQLDDCYVLGVASRCNLFQRNATTGVVISALRGQRNSGWTDTKGYDFGVNYRLPQFSFGRIAIHWNTNYVDYLNTKPDNLADTPVSPSTSFGGAFRVRSNLGLDWALGDFGATWTTRYYSSIKERCSFDNVAGGGPECNMPDYIAPDVGALRLNRSGANTFHDLQFRWNAPWNATVSVGANNVFDHVGPNLYSAPNSQYSYYGGFDIGRFYYVRYNQKF